MFGWVPRPDEVSRFCQELNDERGHYTFAQARADLAGLHERYRFKFAWDAERQLFNQTLPEWDQRRGTCCLQSSINAATKRMYSQRAFYGWPIQYQDEAGNPLQYAFEPSYAAARVQIGKGQCGYADAQGNGDGCCGVWVAESMRKHGLLFRGQYGQWDLRGPREDLAVQWGQPNTGCPNELLAIMAQNRVEQVHHVQSAREMADCMSADYWGFIPSSYGFTQTRDARGMCHREGSWQHSMACMGFYFDDRGNLCFVWYQSWRSANSPNGNDIICMENGAKVQLPQGAFSVSEEDTDGAIKSGGDTWVIGQVPALAA